MTDGQTDTQSALTSLDMLKKRLEVLGVRFRFFCIGFSQNHDANLLGQIAASGNEMGNFVYIRENSPAFQTEIGAALNQAFELAPGSNSLLCRVVEKAENGFNMQTRLFLKDGTNSTYTANVTIPYKVIESGVNIKLEFGNFEIKTIEKAEVEGEEKMNQLLQFFNGQLFELITKASVETTKEALNQIYEDCKAIDTKLNETYIDTLKIKVKDERKKIIEPIQNIKPKIVGLIKFLRSKMLGERMSNDFIASLNQMAYQGVRKTAMQKKIDGRAIQNESKFNELKKELEDYVKTLDLAKIEEENKNVCDEIGNWFLTTKNVTECIQDQDCICIWLDIRRSEATIADPTKLVVKSIVPYYLSADAFIEAAQFTLSKDTEAHGGFDKGNDAELIVGVGRESITGVMPLYIFKEHFEIARKKIPQILGLMCTWDPMGYTPAQFFTVPFLVLHRAFTDYCSDTSSTIKKFILHECLKVWTQILFKIDKDGKEKLQALLKNITEDPIYTTQEHLPSIPLLLSQMYVLHKSNSLVDVDVLKVLSKCVEEFDRRSLDQTLSQTNSSVICKKFLAPNLESEIEEIIKIKFASQFEESKEEKSSKKRDDKEENKKDDMELDAPKKSMFWLWEGIECKGGNDIMSRCPNLVSSISDEILKEQKWLAELSNPDSELSKLLAERTNIFFKYQFWFKHYVREFFGEDNEFYENIKSKKLPLSRNAAAAIILQNLQNPKSSFKKTAIENKDFVEIYDDESASKYFKKVISSVLTKVCESSINKARKLYFTISLNTNAENFSKAEEIKEALAFIKKTKKGRGDVNKFIDHLHESYATNVMEKIKLINNAKIDGKTVFSDKRANKNTTIQKGLSQKKIFNLWLNCCIRNKSVDEAEFFGYFTAYAEKKDWWNKYFNEKGEPKMIKSEEVRAQRRGQKAKWRKRKANKKHS